jgi:hypothetical protein
MKEVAGTVGFGDLAVIDFLGGVENSSHFFVVRTWCRTWRRVVEWNRRVESGVLFSEVGGGRCGTTKLR